MGGSACALINEGLVRASPRDAALLLNASPTHRGFAAHGAPHIIHARTNRHWHWRAASPCAGNTHGAFVAEQRTVSSASRQAVLCIAISSATCREGYCLHRIAHRIALASAIVLRGAVLRMLSRSPPPFEAMSDSATATRRLSMHCHRRWAVSLRRTGTSAGIR